MLTAGVLMDRERPYRSAFADGAAFSFESADECVILYREILKLFEKSLENYL
jgi:hypothetical protein